MHPLGSSLGRFFDSSTTNTLKKLMHIAGLTALECINIFQTTKHSGSSLSASGSERESVFPTIFGENLWFLVGLDIGLKARRRGCPPSEEQPRRVFDFNKTYPSKKLMHIVGLTVLECIHIFQSIKHPRSTLSASGTEHESIFS